MRHVGRVAGRVFNAGGGRANSLSLREATNLVSGIFGRKVRPSLKSQPRTADFVVYYTDNRPVRAALGWSPRIGLEEGYGLIADWVRREDARLRNLYL
jgi:CDP-paratose 2-epimerase